MKEGQYLVTFRDPKVAAEYGKRIADLYQWSLYMHSSYVHDTSVEVILKRMKVSRNTFYTSTTLHLTCTQRACYFCACYLITDDAHIGMHGQQSKLNLTRLLRAWVKVQKTLLTNPSSFLLSSYSLVKTALLFWSTEHQPLICAKSSVKWR